MARAHELRRFAATSQQTFRTGSIRSAQQRPDRADDTGAALVEFALVLPILLVIMLGIVEFGFALSQQLDVRHGAREASRMVATDDFHITEACDRMDLADGAVITLSGATGVVGDEATVRIEAPVQSVTGFFAGWLPASLTSEVRVRIEQDPSWTNGSNTC